MKLENLKTKTLDQVDYFYRQGMITEDVAQAYVELWNTSAYRLTVAEVKDGRINCYPKPE
jgi:hypothetical protein